MQEGLWEEDLRRAMRMVVSEERLMNWPQLDLSMSLYKSLIVQLAILYARRPVVYRDDAPLVDPDAEAVRDAAVRGGLWQLAQANQELVLGLREGAITQHSYEDPRSGETRIGYQVIPLDHFWAVGYDDSPDVPHTFYWYRLRGERWTRDVYSIEDPDQPWFRVEDEDGEPLDVPGVEAVSGDAYLWRYADGTPFLPQTVYHALRTGKMFDPLRNIELVDGSLRVASLWVFWLHNVYDCSFPQRWTMNMEIAGAKAVNGVARVTADPAVIFNFESRPGLPGQAGQWLPGGDPEKLGQAIEAFAQHITSGFDISPTDIKRATGDARSGFAIELTKDGERSAQRKYEPQFQRADSEVLGKTAALLGLPDSDWHVRYTGVPTTFSERQMLIDEHAMRREDGLSSPVQLLAALDDISEDEARRRVEQIMRDNVWHAQLERDLMPPQAAPPPTPPEDDNA